MNKVYKYSIIHSHIFNKYYISLLLSQHNTGVSKAFSNMYPIQCKTRASTAYSEWCYCCSHFWKWQGNHVGTVDTELKSIKMDCHPKACYLYCIPQKSDT